MVLSIENSFIWPTNGTLTSTTTQGQSGPESNGNESVLHISQTSRTGASSLDHSVSYPGHSLEGGI